MSQLSQVNLRYHPLEDRLLLRVRSADDVEYRLWITRRYVKALWPVLLRMVESDDRIRLQQDRQSRKHVLSFQHEHAVSQTDFKTRYREGSAETPLGEAPVLLTRIQFKQVKVQGKPKRVLSLQPAEGKGLEMTMSDVLLHSFMKLLADTVKTAGWELDLGIEVPAAGADVPPARVN